eukprot:gene11749-8481_t
MVGLAAETFVDVAATYSLPVMRRVAGDLRSLNIARLRVGGRLALVTPPQ